MANRRRLIFSTEDSGYFAKLIAKRLGIRRPDISEIERKIFPDGERYYRILVKGDTALVGKDIVYVGSTHTDEALLEMRRVGSALANGGAHRLIFVIPFFGYSTMERAKKERPIEVVTAKENARILSGISKGQAYNTFILLDLHTAGIINYFRDCLRFERSAQDVLAETAVSLGLKNIVFGTTDAGGGKHIQGWARRFGTTFVSADKPDRGEKRIIDAVRIIGEVSGKTVVIVDDMTRSGKTLAEAARAYLAAGAKDVYAIVSHFALNVNHNEVIRLLADSPIRHIITTNSHPKSQLVREHPKFTVCDVSGIFAETIREILV